MSLGLVIATSLAIWTGALYMGLAKSVRKLSEDSGSVAEFFRGRQEFVVHDENDDTGRYVSKPSPFTVEVGGMVRAATGGKTVLRHRVMVDLTPNDPSIRRDLVQSQSSGDGRWLGQYLEAAMRDSSLNRRLLELRRRHEAKGWRMTLIEPAYDHGDSLCVWVELERDVPSLRELEMRDAA